MTVLINMLFSFISTVTFSVLTNIPRKAFVASGITGMIGWMTFWICKNSGISLGFANFLGAFMIGMMSIFFSRKMRMPVTIFNIPSLVPLVPGGPAYMALRQMIQGNITSGLDNLVTVLITSGAIAIGFMITGLVETVLRTLRRNIARNR